MGFVILVYVAITLAVALFAAVVIFYARIWSWIFDHIERFMRKSEARNRRR